VGLKWSRVWLIHRSSRVRYRSAPPPRCPLPLSGGGSQSPTASPPRARRTTREATAKRCATAERDPIATNSVPVAAASGSGSGCGHKQASEESASRGGKRTRIFFVRFRNPVVGNVDADSVGPTFLLGLSFLFETLLGRTFHVVVMELSGLMLNQRDGAAFVAYEPLFIILGRRGFQTQSVGILSSCYAILL
jgi:hypothetical protein